MQRQHEGRPDRRFLILLHRTCAAVGCKSASSGEPLTAPELLIHTEFQQSLVRYQEDDI